MDISVYICVDHGSNFGGESPCAHLMVKELKAALQGMTESPDMGRLAKFPAWKNTVNVGYPAGTIS